MAQYRVDVSEVAENDLLDIVRHIASQFSAPVTALNMVDLLEEAMTSLSEMPQRFPLLADDRLSQMGYRKLAIKNYIVVFSIDKKTIRKTEMVFEKEIDNALRDVDNPAMRVRQPDAETVACAKKMVVMREYAINNPLRLIDEGASVE